MQQIIYIQFIIFIIVSLGFLLAGFSIVKKTNSDFEPMDYQEVMSIIDEGIRQQFHFRYKLEYELKDIHVIYDFEKELNSITKSVLFSFSKDFYKHCDYYHDRDWIYRYTTKQVEIGLLKLQNQIKVKTK